MPWSRDGSSVGCAWSGASKSGFFKSRQVRPTSPKEKLDWADRMRCGWEAVRDIVGKVWLYVILGIAVGAGIHGYVPEGVMASFMGKSAWWSVPLSVLVGIPMYSNAAGIIPIVHALIEKGAALGTVLAFMMSVIALSFPEMIILRKVLKPRLDCDFYRRGRRGHPSGRLSVQLSLVRGMQTASCVGGNRSTPGDPSAKAARWAE